MKKLGKYIYECGGLTIDIRIIGGFDGQMILSKSGAYIGGVLNEESVLSFKDHWLAYNAYLFDKKITNAEFPTS